jgi:hypothetical protein
MAAGVDTGVRGGPASIGPVCHDTLEVEASDCP